MPILEAMAGKCPVVASDIPVLRESGGDAVQYAAPQDPSDFARVIQTVLQSPQLQQEMITKGEIHVQNFSWNANTDCIVKKTNELLANKL